MKKKRNIFVTANTISFSLIRETFCDLEIPLLQSNLNSILVWYDDLKDKDYFLHLLPWQTVNRYPGIFIVCRKAPFVRIIQRITPFFPDLYNFLPQSFILPTQGDEFVKFRKASKLTFLLKPDRGSLGQGIILLPPKKRYEIGQRLYVAQEYINSYLIGGFKFDLRIYCLILGTSPLKIYVYREGVARFCSQEASSPEKLSKFSTLTNTAVNIKNQNVDASTITKTIKEVLEIISRDGVDIENLWKSIDEAIALTILGSGSFLTGPVANKCKPLGEFSRCFQILGFDILLDENAKPWVLEVNYRPSLSKGTFEENLTKSQLIKESLEIALPYDELQEFVTSNLGNLTPQRFIDYVMQPSVQESIKIKRLLALNNSNFVQIFPTSDPEKKAWGTVLTVANQFPTGNVAGYMLPKLVLNKDMKEKKGFISTPVFSPHSLPNLYHV